MADEVWADEEMFASTTNIDMGFSGELRLASAADGSWVNGRRILNDMPFADALEIWKAT